ncbi:hypothetical protein SAY86_018423 [Trapa natans]|uniref:Phytocyanin domain-containing protein n=1 Tax=Trapa natans TaxID=22666 RepID=A0AAN7R0X6_TRANT|nr:hypothetical protein SAY86_018423 [Trapa natans]
MTVAGMFKYLFLVALFIEHSAAATYIVGGPNGGWDTATDQQTWASNQSFRVGDNLVFQYYPSHDVTEVSKAEYDSCQASNPIVAYVGGLSLIPLTSPGKRYFICSIPGHCSAGMKLAVDTLPGTSAVPAESPVASSAPKIPMSSPSESPIPEPPLPPPSASPVPSTWRPVAGVQGSEDPTNSTPLSHSTTLDSPDTSASRSRFPVGCFGKSLSFVVMVMVMVMMLMGL